MAFILPRPGYFVKQRFLKRFRHCRQALVRIRYLIIINNWNGRSAREIERVLRIHNTTVYRVVRNFRERGEASRWDGVKTTAARSWTPIFWDCWIGWCGPILKSTVGVGRLGRGRRWWKR